MVYLLVSLKKIWTHTIILLV